MLYQDAVKEARQLLSKTEEDLWKLAELTHTIVDVQKTATATKWGEDLGVTGRRVHEYLLVYRRFNDPARRIAGRSFNEHCELARASQEVAAELVAEAERTGQKVSTIRKQRSLDAAYRARMNAEKDRLYEEVASNDDLLEDATRDKEAIKTGRDLAKQRELERQIVTRNEDEVKTGFAPIARAAAGLAVLGTDTMLEKVRDHIHMLVEADADIPETMVRRLNKMLTQISEDLTVYTARKGMANITTLTTP